MKSWKAVPLVLVFAAAIAVRAVIGTNVDVSWLLTVGERMLAGDRLYADLIEVNPPASALLYLPAFLLARTIGISPETAVDALVLTAAACSLWLCARILARTRMVEENAWLLLAGAAAVLTILPMHTFGEREHIAIIALLPLLALLAVRANGGSPALAAALIAGVGAGITVAIKPHFALAVGCAVAASAYARGSWRVVFAVENWIAGAVAAAYGIYVVVAYPEFLRDVVPLVQAAYLPMRKGLSELVSPLFLCWLASLALLLQWKRGRVLAPPLSPLLAAAIGFAAVYFIQGKGWPYHVYPMLALTFIALVIAAAEETEPQGDPAAKRRRSIARLVPVAALIAASGVWLNFSLDMSALADPIRRLKARPSLLAITSDIAVGHPLTRELGGKWVSRVGSLWITTGVYRQFFDGKLDPGTRARLERHVVRDRAWLAEDIRRNRPDIIIVEKGKFDWEAWARADPVIAAELARYREAGGTPGFLLLQRHGS